MPPLTKRGRLFRKYAIFVVALLSFALLASGAIGAYFSFQDNEAALVAIESEKAHSAAELIERFMTETVSDLATALGSGQTDEATLLRRHDDFVRVLHQVQAVSWLQYIDASGALRITESRDQPNFFGQGEDQSASDAFRLARAPPDDPYLGPVSFDSRGEPHMVVALRETGRGGGVVVADLLLKDVREVISGIRAGTAGHAYAVDSTGQLIVHPDVGLVLAGTNLSSLPQVAAAIASAPPGSPEQAITIGRDLAGENVLTATQPIEPLGWHVFIEQPQSEAFAPLYAALFRTVVLIGVGVALAIVASLILTRRMVTPIERLQTAAARIAAGNLNETIEIRTGDELESLADEFNRMTEQLRRSYAELEQRVEDRTRDLAATRDELEVKSRDLEAASRHKTEFLANMSHELRTPLNAIIGFSDVLHAEMFGPLNKAQHQYVEDVLEAGRHLLSLINDILDLSKVEAGRMELTLTDMSIPEALESGLTMQRPRASKDDITLNLDVDPNFGVVRADDRKIRQVIFNLLSNALKFTPSGGRVDVTARRRDGIVEVAVADTGVGISPEDQERIFEEFQQASGQNDSVEGTGLGLTLSRKFIELHGGRLWVESEIGSGSTFRFTLPTGTV